MMEIFVIIATIIFLALIISIAINIHDLKSNIDVRMKRIIDILDEVEIQIRKANDQDIFQRK